MIRATSKTRYFARLRPDFLETYRCPVDLHPLAGEQQRQLAEAVQRVLQTRQAHQLRMRIGETIWLADVQFHRLGVVGVLWSEMP